ncbi:hypothetical protein LSH36_12g30020 [Paralvinella palmiformis]|uniref:Uncharacterized protein n=1 Tax=Paralvinella palmiformis TaxID=53620 RepID=A0AAD9NI49_9ANNE|nr:hypothetical protein LSH36_12g30020 [Paralvinella palmiformis]
MTTSSICYPQHTPLGPVTPSSQSGSTHAGTEYGHNPGYPSYPDRELHPVAVDRWRHGTSNRREMQTPDLTRINLSYNVILDTTSRSTSRDPVPYSWPLQRDFVLACFIYEYVYVIRVIPSRSQAAQVLDLLKTKRSPVASPDTASVDSGQSSNTDSGCIPSEEGDLAQHRQQQHHQQQQQHHPAAAATAATSAKALWCCDLARRDSKNCYSPADRNHCQPLGLQLVRRATTTTTSDRTAAAVWCSRTPTEPAAKREQNDDTPAAIHPVRFKHVQYQSGTQ